MALRLSSSFGRLVGACAIVGAAVAGPLAAANAGFDRTNPALPNVSSNRVYFYVGSTGYGRPFFPTKLHRG